MTSDPEDTGLGPSIADELKPLDNFLGTLSKNDICGNQQESPVAFKTAAYAEEVRAFDDFIHRGAVDFESEVPNSLASSNTTGFPHGVA